MSETESKALEIINRVDPEFTEIQGMLSAAGGGEVEWVFGDGDDRALVTLIINGTDVAGWHRYGIEVHNAGAWWDLLEGAGL